MTCFVCNIEIDDEDINYVNDDEFHMECYVQYIEMIHKLREIYSESILEK